MPQGSDLIIPFLKGTSIPLLTENHVSGEPTALFRLRDERGADAHHNPAGLFWCCFWFRAHYFFSKVHLAAVCILKVCSCWHLIAGGIQNASGRSDLSVLVSALPYGQSFIIHLKWGNHGLQEYWCDFASPQILVTWFLEGITDCRNILLWFTVSLRSA